MVLALDRFETGSPDSQCSPVFAECEGCGGEIYLGGQYYEFTGRNGRPVICHTDQDCLERAIGAEPRTAGE